VGDELRFYYGGRTSRHSPYHGPDKGKPGGGIGLGIISRDRFVSLESSFDVGIIRTKPVKLEGQSLHVNAKCDFGSIIVEVYDMSDRLIAKSKPLQSDSIDITVEWQEGSLEQINFPVELRFYLSNAQLFSIWCR
jgi:hypothetical protein